MSSAASAFHEPGRQVSRSAKAHLEADNNRNKPYVPHDVITETSKTALTGLGAGFFIAALRNATSRQNVGAWASSPAGPPSSVLPVRAVSFFLRRGREWRREGWERGEGEGGFEPNLYWRGDGDGDGDGIVMREGEKELLS